MGRNTPGCRGTVPARRRRAVEILAPGYDCSPRCREAESQSRQARAAETILRNGAKPRSIFKKHVRRLNALTKNETSLFGRCACLCGGRFVRPVRHPRRLAQARRCKPKDGIEVIRLSIAQFRAPRHRRSSSRDALPRGIAARSRVHRQRRGRLGTGAVMRQGKSATCHAQSAHLNARTRRRQQNKSRRSRAARSRKERGAARRRGHRNMPASASSAPASTSRISIAA